MKLLQGLAVPSAKCKRLLCSALGPFVLYGLTEPSQKPVASFVNLPPCISTIKREYMTALIQQVYITHTVLRKQCFQLFRTRSSLTFDAWKWTGLDDAHSLKPSHRCAI